MTEDEIRACFTPPGGSYRFARWGRPVAPVVFGADDATLAAFKGAFRTVTGLARLPMADTDPEIGANLLVFLARDWDDIAAIPDLDRMIPGFAALAPRLRAARANQYRSFRFDAGGAIRAAFVLAVIDDHIAATPADVLALSHAVQTILLWSDAAFHVRPALVQAGGRVALRPAIAALIAAAYDPVLPDNATDPAHALRLMARLPQGDAPSPEGPDVS